MFIIVLSMQCILIPSIVVKRTLMIYNSKIFCTISDIFPLISCITIELSKVIFYNQWSFLSVLPEILHLMDITLIVLNEYPIIKPLNWLKKDLSNLKNCSKFDFVIHILMLLDSFIKVSGVLKDVIVLILNEWYEL